MGRGATGAAAKGWRLYSSEGAVPKFSNVLPTLHHDPDIDDLPEQGEHEPLSERVRTDYRKMFDDVEKDDSYEPGAPAGRLVVPVGTAYSTSERKRSRAIEEPEEDMGGKTVHVLGFDPKAYFIAHCLAGYEYLNPVKLLIHKRAIWNTWEREGKRLLLLQGVNRILHDRAEAEWIGTGYMARSNEHIEQLVVTVPCHQTRQAIENIKHRIDHRTTICLVQDGLGVVEELNATLFVDPTTRPTYIVGHSTAYIGHYKPTFFAAMLRNPGKLYLTPMERGVGLPFFSYHPPIERRVHGVKFLRTLVGTHGLGAGGFSLENYLVKKLPEMVFQSIIEPMAIALDTTYDQVLRNQHAILLADELLEELFNVIWAMPELNNSYKLVKFCGMEALRKHTVNRLANKGNSQSQYLAHVRAGRMVDIDYLNGYFVKRGQELGIKTSRNEMMLEIVKARVESRKKQLRGLVPFEGLSTMPVPGPGNQYDE